MDVASPERWPEIEDLFAQAIDLGSPERARFLDNLSQTDPPLARELDRLLSAYDSAGIFLESFDARRGAALLQSSDEIAEDTPDTIGRYRVVRRLGGGGMGEVFLGYDPSLERPVAIKLLHRRLASGEEGRRLLIEEARATSGLDHPNIAPVHEIGETAAGRVFVSMAFCEGESLAERISRGPLAAREAAALGRQIADALAAAHRRGITHRDLKPANVIVSPDGRVRLVDFGIAKVAGRRGVRGDAEPGTLAYMSPEQTGGTEVGARSDLWSLGVLLYEAVTGRRPFRGDTYLAMVHAIRASVPEDIRQTRPDVPAALARLIDQCLSKDPAERPAGANAVAAELEAFLAGNEKGRVAPARRRRWMARGIAVIGLVVAGVSARYLMGGAENEDALAAMTVAILPFTPVAPDSALERLGRELVVTLSSSLAGVGGIRIVDPVAILGQTNPGPGLPLERAAPLARRFGAGQLLHGSLTASGTTVRLDVAVHATADYTVLARASVEAPADDITRLTDAAAVALLRSEWSTVAGAAPNPSALTSRSLPALRAYLEGELSMASGRFRAAPIAFERAIREDSSFWFAYWRYVYALSYHGAPVDSAILNTVYAHRTDFPESDRLLVEVRFAGGQRERIDLLREITTRFPEYWPAWFELGDELTHHGAFLGRPAEQAISALERTANLNSSFLPAWEHLFWMAVHARDSARSGRALSMMRDFPIDSLNFERPDLETLTYYRYLDHLTRTGGAPREAEAAVGARVLSDFAGPMPAEWLAASLTNYGFHRAQLDLSRRVRAREPRADILAAQHWGAALSFAGLGFWDSAFVAAQRYARTTAHPGAPLWSFGLLSVGAWLGEVPPASLTPLRAAALTSERGATPEGRAEIAWLDGLVACARDSQPALRRQRHLLERSTAPSGAALGRSLAALDNAMTGFTVPAARSLAAMEWENADSAWHFDHGAIHPFFSAVNRIAAAGWLLAAGDTAEVMRLLLLQNASLPQPLHPLPAANAILAGLTMAELASLEESRGSVERGRRYRARLQESERPSINELRMTSPGPCGAPLRDSG